MLVIVGGSASGKDTIARELCKDGSYHRIKAFTTRPTRDDDHDDYHYVAVKGFEQLEKSGFFAVTSEYRGWRYGIAKAEVVDDFHQIVICTPADLRRLRNQGHKILAVYVDVDRESRLIGALQRGDDFNEAIRRAMTEDGQFDGVRYDVEYILENHGYQADPEECAKMVREIVEKEENAIKAD